MGWLKKLLGPKINRPDDEAEARIVSSPDRETEVPVREEVSSEVRPQPKPVRVAYDCSAMPTTFCTAATYTTFGLQPVTAMSCAIEMGSPRRPACGCGVVSCEDCYPRGWEYGDDEDDF